MIETEIRKHCEQKFATHKATLLQDTDRYCIIDWRREDGSGEYYVNYIVDKERGSLIVSGDLGDSIATWYNPVTAHKLASYVNDIGYYISKMQCSSDKFHYELDDIVSDIRNLFSHDELDLSGYYREDEFWDEIEDEAMMSCHDDNFYPTERLYDMISEQYPDYCENLHCCGRRIAPRVYLWAVGFQMACKQLDL